MEHYVDLFWIQIFLCYEDFMKDENSESKKQDNKSEPDNFDKRVRKRIENFLKD